MRMNAIKITRVQTHPDDHASRKRTRWATSIYQKVTKALRSRAFWFVMRETRAISRARRAKYPGRRVSLRCKSMNSASKEFKVVLPDSCDRQPRRSDAKIAHGQSRRILDQRNLIMIQNWAPNHCFRCGYQFDTQLESAHPPTSSAASKQGA